MAVGPDAPFLKEALDSLEEQTFRDFEVLIQREPGIHKAWNVGARKASGEYLAIMDSDDVAAPTRLEAEVWEMDSDRELGVVAAWARCFGKSVRMVRHPVRITKSTLLLRNPIVNGACMVRKEVAMPYGPWRATPWIDYDLWCRMAAQGVKMLNIPKVLVFRREHDANDSRGRPLSRLIHGEVSARWQLLGRSPPD